jgi:hypothetical protein
MTTSLASSILAEPDGDERISAKSLAYVSEAARDELYNLVLRTCVEAGVNKATLAKRLGKDPAQITRLLGAPGNWTIDTFAQLLFAIDGRMLSAQSYWPLQQPISNRRHSNCLVDWEVVPSGKVRNLTMPEPPKGQRESAGGNNQGMVGTLKWQPSQHQ